MTMALNGASFVAQAHTSTPIECAPSCNRLLVTAREYYPLCDCVAFVCVC